jgi:Nucleotidyltransferase substrate binding protein like.
MNTQDVRWIQRYNHFVRAFTQLEQAVALSHSRSLSELEKQGLIHAFEYTHELAWNTLKIFLRNGAFASCMVQKTVPARRSSRVLLKLGKYGWI